MVSVSTDLKILLCINPEYGMKEYTTTIAAVKTDEDGKDSGRGNG